jgi:hypothetical protein
MSAVPDWLVRHLVQTYSLPEAAARHVVAARMVLPVLDGLDEMDAADLPGFNSRAAQAVRACNAYLSSGQKAGIVLTCRIGQYEALEGAYEWVQDAARVEIRPVTLPRARAFLTRRTSDAERWKPVLSAMRPGGNEALSRALSTPWRLTLAAAVYDQRDPATGAYLRDPKALISADLNTDDKIRDHLLGLFIPAVGALHGQRYPAALVHRWLATLAHYLQGNTPAATRCAREIGGRALSATDLVLQELWPLAGGRLPRALPTILAAFGWVPIAVYVVAVSPDRLSFRQILIIGGPLLVALWLTYVSWARIWPAPLRLDPRQLRTRSGRGRVTVGLTAGLAVGLCVGLAIGSVVGVVVGLAAVPTFALAAGLARTNYAPAGPRDALKSTILVGFGAGAGAALVAGLTVGLTAGLPLGYLPGPVHGLSDGLTFGVAAGLSIGLVVWLAYQPQSGRYLALLLCTRRWTRRWLPWRLGRFLDWCYSAGLLRIAGIGYQFRHRELQDYLADHPIT